MNNNCIHSDYQWVLNLFFVFKSREQSENIFSLQIVFLWFISFLLLTAQDI
jgi:hypothetical protein